MVHGLYDVWCMACSDVVHMWLFRGVVWCGAHVAFSWCGVVHMWFFRGVVWCGAHVAFPWCGAVWCGPGLEPTRCLGPGFLPGVVVFVIFLLI